MAELRGNAGKHLFVGGGIASMAGALFLLRDCGISGGDITIFEAETAPGGSLDAKIINRGNYFVRGARMFESNFVCTQDLMRSVPSSDLPGGSLYDDFEDFNMANPVHFGCERLQDGRILERHSTHFGLKDGADLLYLLLSSENSLGATRICDCFQRSFFDTEFWLALSSAFAFQPWHSAAELRRYIRRFLHFEMPPENRSKILTTRYNQYESLIEPLRAHLLALGVKIRTGTGVTSATFRGGKQAGESRRVSALHFNGGSDLHLTPADKVYFTIGSITDGSAYETNGDPPPAKTTMQAWNLWRKLANSQHGFGRPSVFAYQDGLTDWQSFTLTVPAGPLLNYLRSIRPVGALSALVTAVKHSPWRLSLVPFSQPHFRNQSPDTHVIWGYALRPDQAGRFCGRPMTEATVEDIIAEIAGHLAMDSHTARDAFHGTTMVSCRMPLITSQFMPRTIGDRACTKPSGSINFACMGQFVELPHDTVFTVEYSVRSAWAAIAALNPNAKEPPPVIRSDQDPRVLAYALAHILNLRD